MGPCVTWTNDDRIRWRHMYVDDVFLMSYSYGRKRLLQFILTHWRHMATDLGQRRIRWWRVALRHQTITWIIVDLITVRFSVINLRAISQENPGHQSQNLSWQLRLNFLSNLTRANGLSYLAKYHPHISSKVCYCSSRDKTVPLFLDFSTALVVWWTLTLFCSFPWRLPPNCLHPDR